MNNYSIATVMAALALTAPMVSHAQDPLSSLGQVKKLSGAGRADEALALCEQVLKRYSGNGAMAKQFAYLMPFYAYEKGEILRTAKRYDEAYNAYKEFRDSAKWKDKALLEKAKAMLKDRMPEAYAPYLTQCIFQMGHCRYLQGAGDAKTPGVAAKFDEAIPLLEEYLDLLKKNKVSRTERQLKLDGRVCFLLVQSYLLKPQPDFKKAGQYLDLSRKSKGRVPDDLAMTGLGTIVKVATQNPENAGWIYKVIESSPASYRMEPLRAATHAAKFLNHGVKAASVAGKSMGTNPEMALEALRSANALLGLVPDVREVSVNLVDNIKGLGKYTGVISDPIPGTSYSAARQKKTFASYKNMLGNNQNLEGLAIMYTGNTALNVGSTRLGKAGFQVLADRYPNLSSGVKKDKDGKPMEKDGKPVLNELRNTIFMQLSQLCYATGDDEGGAKYEKRVDGASLEGGQSKSLAFNKLRRILSQQQWAEVIPAAEAVKNEYKDNPSNKFYATAQYSIVAAYYKQQMYDELIPAARELLGGKILVAGEGKDALTAKEVATYGSQGYYFLIDAYMKKARQDAKLYDEAIAVFEEFAKTFPSLSMEENVMVHHMHYNVADAYLKKAERTVDEAAQEKLKEQALSYLKVITDNWPKCDYYPTAELLTASVNIMKDDMAVKQSAIAALERATDAALAMEDGKSTAANALYWLASYGKEIKNEGESDDAQAARVKGYVDRFWKEADYEGNSFALQMVSEMLATVKDKESFAAAVERARTVIGREATYNHNQNQAEPELEKTINAYVKSYVAGSKTYDGKELTLEEKTQHFTNFPGIQPTDKYARAIFRMAQIRAMNEELKGLEDETAKNKMTNDIQATFREMTREFRPDDLTNFICVQVGDYLVRYVSEFPKPSERKDEINLATTYYDKVLERKGDMQGEAQLGKANALAFSGEADKQKEAEVLYTQIASSPSAAVSAPALMGLTKLHLSSGNAAAAVETASKYVAVNRTKNNDRLDMLLMLGEAYAKSGKVKEALQTYMNLYNQNKGNISYSAPACKAIMELFWERNAPASGDRLKGNFKASDRWNAWNTGQQYVTLIKRSNLLDKITPAERDAYNAVENLLNKYKADAGVQKEDKANRDFQSQLKKR
ncbi:MAG: hypothetical protein IJB00_02965 [Akkermansia sp.]|nr:hypothetical protein [Akkermansia sp.]